jgi:hypothetical protein
MLVEQEFEKGKSLTSSLGKVASGVGGSLLKGVGVVKKLGKVRHPDAMITKDPLMRSRYLIGGNSRGINLQTIHDTKLTSAPRGMSLDRLRAASQLPKRRL